MVESCTDIQKYLEIIYETDDGSSSEPFLVEVSNVNCIGAGQRYSYANGTRWIEIISDEDDCWLVECGLLEHSAQKTEFYTKRDIDLMIQNGDIVLCEETETDELMESLNDKEFDHFIEKVDRYLLINEGKDSSDFSYNWRKAWTGKYPPAEAAQDAILGEK